MCTFLQTAISNSELLVSGWVLSDLQGFIAGIHCREGEGEGEGEVQYH